MHARVRALAMILFIALLPLGSLFAQTATVMTDKADYLPGDVVRITGSGWEAGEVVKLAITHSTITHGEEHYTAVADMVGNISNEEFVIQDYHFGEAFLLSATGLSSGQLATTSFTDGNVGTWSYTVSTSAAPNTTNVVTTTITVNILTVTTVNGCGAISIGIPSGVTLSNVTVSARTASNEIVPWNFDVIDATILKTSRDQSAHTRLLAGGKVTYTFQSSYSAGGQVCWSDVMAFATNGYNQPFGTPESQGGQCLQVQQLCVNTQISSNVSGSSITYGADAVFAVTASGTGLSYQWQLNGNPIAGANSSSYTVAQPAVSASGNSYRCVISNTCNQVTNSASGVLQVAPRPVTASFTAGNKQYDGNSNASITGSSLSNTLANDNVALSGGSASFGDANVGSGKAVTVTGFTLSGTAASNYSLTSSSASTTADITARPLTVTADAASKTYGNSDPALSYQITSGSLVFGDALAGSLSRAAGEDVGAYAISSSLANSNYAITYVGADLAITARSIAVAADAQSKTYGDADPSLTYQVTSGSIAFSDAFSGSLTRAAGEDAGSYAITQGSLALNANYSLSFTGSNLSIGARSISVTADAQSKVYGDADPSLTYQVTAGSLAFSDAFSGSLSRAGGENVGSYAIGQGSLALNANYNLTYAGADLTIGARAVTVTADGQSKTYGDADPALTYQLTSGSLAFGDAFSGALSRTAGENVGSYPIGQGSLALNGNYNLSFAGANLAIGARAITLTAAAQSKVYGDADPALGYSVTAGSMVAGDSFTGGLSRASGEDVGSYAISSTLANSNYAITYVGADLSITARAISVAADAQSKTYGDADPALTYQVTAGTLAFSDAFSGALSRTAGEAVGSYPISQGSLALSNNYSLTFNGANLNIGRRTVTPSFTASDKTYDGNASASISSRSLSNNMPGDDVSLSGGTASFASQNVGTWTVSASGFSLSGNDAANYQLSATSASASASITARAISVQAHGKTKVYGNNDPQLTYQVTAGALVQGESFSGALSRYAGENVGSYAITQGTLALSSNYSLSYAGANLAITERAITVTADNKSKVYGTTDPALSYTINSGSLVSGDAFTGSIDRDPGQNAATYAIRQGTLGLSSNYALTFNNGVFTINKATLTLTALNASTNYGVTACAPYQGGNGYTLSGFVNGESQNTATAGTVTYAGTSQGAVNVGSYSIIPGGLTSQNYNINVVNGTLTIGAAMAQPQATSYYTGSGYFWTTSSTSSTATLTLAATLVNKPGVCGNISTARASFYFRNGDGSLTAISSAQSLPVGLVDPANTNMGTASAIVQYNLGSSAYDVKQIAVVISGNYKNDTAIFGSVADALITIAKPMAGGHILGAGKISNGTSAGYIKGSTDSGKETVYSFEVAYSKSLKNPQGSATIWVYSKQNRFGVVDGIEHYYRIKSNAIAVLAITTPKANFTAKCNVAEIVNGVEQAVEGNCTMILNMMEACPGQLAITIQRNSGGIWFSSNWVNNNTALKPVFNPTPGTSFISVSGIPVNCNTITSRTLSNPSKEREVAVIDGDFKAYPNPSISNFTVRVPNVSTSSASIRIADMYGRTVQVIQRVNAGETLKLGADLRPGVYILELIQDGKRQTLRLVKQ